jgi:acylphosphatase
MKVCFLAHVSGTVQGVYFRASAQQQAIDLSISGYARNLADGDVEVMMCGEPDNVEKMITWLHSGPEQAVVNKVNVKQVEFQNYTFFSMG